MDNKQQHLTPVGQRRHRRAGGGGLLIPPSGQRNGGLLRPAGRADGNGCNRLDQLQAANNNTYLDTTDPYFERAVGGTAPVENWDDFRGRSQVFHDGAIRAQRAGCRNVRSMGDHFERGYNLSVDMANQGMDTFQNTGDDVGNALALVGQLTPILGQLTPILQRVQQENQQSHTYFQSSMGAQQQNHQQFYAHSNSFTSNTSRFMELDRQCGELLSSTIMAAPPTPPTASRAPLAARKNIGNSNPQDDILSPVGGRRTWRHVKFQVVEDFKSGVVGLNARLEDFWKLDNRDYKSISKQSFSSGLSRLRNKERQLWDEIVAAATANSEN